MPIGIGYKKKIKKKITPNLSELKKKVVSKKKMFKK